MKSTTVTFRTTPQIKSWVKKEAKRRSKKKKVSVSTVINTNLEKEMNKKIPTLRFEKYNPYK